MKTMNRRDALAGAAGMLLVKPATAFGSQANSAVSLGIIGTGGRGRYVGTIFVKDPRTKLAAICDIFPDRIDLGKTQIPGADAARVYKNHEELLAAADIDAVLIATPVFLHPEHFEHAVNARKHIYCEKPAGASVAGVKRLMRAAERADKTKHIQFGFQQRFSPEYLAAEKLINEGAIGSLSLMQSHWVVGGARPGVPALVSARGGKTSRLVFVERDLGRLHRRAGLPRRRRTELVLEGASVVGHRRRRTQGARLR